MVVGYTRRSRERDNGAFSLDDQEARIRAWAAFREVELDQLAREDDVSGSLPPDDRRVLGPILAGLRKGDSLVVAKFDRLSRSLRDFADLLERCQREGWALVCLDPEIDLTTPAGEAFAGMLGVFARFEVRQYVERMKGGRRAKAAKGGYIGGGTVPFGYRVENGAFIEVPAEQKFIRRIVALRREGRTWKQVGAALEMHPNTVKKVYYRETGEPRSRVHKGASE